MGKHKAQSVELKHQVVQEYLAGETLHGLARRHNLPRSLIRIWVDAHLYSSNGDDPCEAPALQGIAALADTIHECETRIETIERLVAKRAMELGAGRPERPQSGGALGESTSGRSGSPDTSSEDDTD